MHLFENINKVLPEEKQVESKLTKSVLKCLVGKKCRIPSNGKMS